MIVAVIGSRTWTDVAAVEECVRTLVEHGVTVATGCAMHGVDAMVRDACKRLGVEPRVFRANWNAVGRRAGPLRNKQLVAAADEVIAFRRAGPSPGTDSAVAWARRLEKPCQIVR